MAKTLALGKVPKAFGAGMKIAVGTIYAISDAGSFAVYTDSAGSKIMRNIQVAIVQPFSGSVYVTAKGSSDGYVAVGMEVAGTPIPIGGTIDLPCNFIVLGGAGSI